MDAIRPIQDGPSTPPQIQQPTVSTNPDLIKILLRWKWLPILGSIVGATMGFLYFGQLPHKYKAIAKIQVVSPAREVPLNNGLNQQFVNDRSRSDELVVVSSESVLSRAVERGALTSNRKLKGMSAEEIVKYLRTPKLIESKLGSNDLNSDIITIAITTNDATLSGDLVQAVVAGYEDFVTGNLKNYTKEAKDALTKFADAFEKSKGENKAILDRVKSNKDLIMKDGEPHDPLADNAIALLENIRKLDQQKRTIESILANVVEGRKNNRSLEYLLTMVTQMTKEAGFKEDANDVRQQDRLGRKIANIESYEQNFVTPARTTLEILRGESLGDSHPKVATAKKAVEKAEEYLAKLKDELKKESEEYGLNKADVPTLEGKLNSACGALDESLNSIALERNKCVLELEASAGKREANQREISQYHAAFKELDAFRVVADQVSENLRRLSINSEFGQKTVNRLDLPSIGGFDGPYWIQYVGVGGLMGFLAFSGLAYLLEMADRSYRNPDEIASDLGMPIIGHLPLATISRAERVDEKVDSSIVTLHKARAPISEAFRGIRTSLFFGCQQSGIKVIQVTSPIPGDGKSTIAANIAVSVAQSGRRVCLVDCDFRRPRVAKIFGLREDTGFVQVIGGKVELSQAIQQTTVDNLSALTCGRRPANPAELLSSEVFGDLIANLRNQFDFVIVDTPPMLAVSDPANVASHVDGVLLTIRLRRNLRPIATRAAQMLHAINANMIGVVVNGIGVGGNSYGYGGYRYDNYTGGRGSGYGKTGYGGYGYGTTYQYGGYYGGTNVGRDYYDDSIPKTPPKKTVKT
jgi:polysaccharide biosynthesis transport protein